MLLEAEDSPALEADALEHSVSVKQAVVEDRDGGLLFGNQFSVEVDFHGKIGPADGQDRTD